MVKNNGIIRIIIFEKHDINATIEMHDMEVKEMYEEPNMELIKFDMVDVIRTSPGDGQGGDGDGSEGPWG